MQIERTENAKKKCKKKCNLQGKKGARDKKMAVQNGSKLFSDAFSAGESLSFQGINCKNFCQEKVENAKKKCNIQGKKGPSQKKNAKKNSKKCNHTQKSICKTPQNAKKNVLAYLTPCILASVWHHFEVVLVSFWHHFETILDHFWPLLDLF